MRSRDTCLNRNRVQGGWLGLMRDSWRRSTRRKKIRSSSSWTYPGLGEFSMKALIQTTSQAGERRRLSAWRSSKRLAASVMGRDMDEEGSKAERSAISFWRSIWTCWERRQIILCTGQSCF